jgi:hypothetical protein
MSTQKVYPVYSFQYIQNKLVELSRQKLNYADLPEQVQADWTETDITSYAYIKNKPTIPAIIGDVVGPASSVDGDVVLFDGTTGKLIKDSGVAFTDVMQKSVYDTDLDGIVDTAEKIMLEVINKTGATIPKGKIVYIKSSSSSATHPEILLADNTSEATSTKTLGAVYQDIADSTTGFIVTNGQVHNLNTSAYSIGDKLWLGTSGDVTTTVPSAPNHAVFIGHVTRSQTVNGRIFYSIQNGFELQELHNVLINSVANNDVLTYESSTSLWKNKTIATILGYTPQAQITLTTTGSSGSATFVSNTLNIPTYTADGLLPSQTGNSGKYLTTNGTTTSWATVSSGGMTNPMTTAGDIIYGGASGTPTRLGIGTAGFILQAGASAPAWFDLFGTANTFTAQQTIQSNTNRVIRLNGINSGGYASGTTITASAANQPVTVTNAQGIIFTHNESVNTNTYFPLFTFANRSLGGYVATVPEWQLRMFSPGSGSTGCRIMEITIPSSTAFTASQIAERWDIFQTSSSYAFKQHYLRTSIDTAGALNPASALLHIGAGATGYAQINLKTSAGTAPSAPADGDIWYDGTNLKMRVGATTKTFTLV